MTNDLLQQIIDLLTSIDSKLDELHGPTRRQSDALLDAEWKGLDFLDDVPALSVLHRRRDPHEGARPPVN